MQESDLTAESHTVQSNNKLQEFCVLQAFFYWNDSLRTAAESVLAAANKFNGLLD